MANIFASSIGKKLIMSISGLFLIVFLLVHMVANMTILFGEDIFNSVCDFMGTNPIVQVMVPVLAFGVCIHILYACIITVRNYLNKRNNTYEVASKAKASSWSSRNMFVLGIIIVLGLALHLLNFWSKMQLQEFMGAESAQGATLVRELFLNPWYCLIYFVWLLALWYHLGHGFWSAFHTVGWNNQVWLKRWQVISKIYATIVLLGFLSIPAYFLFGSLFTCC